MITYRFIACTEKFSRQNPGHFCGKGIPPYPTEVGSQSPCAISYPIDRSLYVYDIGSESSRGSGVSILLSITSSATPPLRYRKLGLGLLIAFKTTTGCLIGRALVMWGKAVINLRLSVN